MPGIQQSKSALKAALEIPWEEFKNSGNVFEEFLGNKAFKIMATSRPPKALDMSVTRRGFIKGKQHVSAYYHPSAGWVHGTMKTGAGNVEPMLHADIASGLTGSLRHASPEALLDANPGLLRIGVGQNAYIEGTHVSEESLRKPLGDLLASGHLTNQTMVDFSINGAEPFQKTVGNYLTEKPSYLQQKFGRNIKLIDPEAHGGYATQNLKTVTINNVGMTKVKHSSSVTRESLEFIPDQELLKESYNPGMISTAAKRADTKGIIIDIETDNIGHMNSVRQSLKAHNVDVDDSAVKTWSRRQADELFARVMRGK